MKLDNILFFSDAEGNYDLRVADFGLSVVVTPGSELREVCGTPTYIAPEILSDEAYTTKADIFSLGSVMFNLISGRYLF